MPDPIINDEQTTKSSIEQIYDAINNVLGGTNPQQMLCLTIPGTVLDKESYVYDTRFEKPINVPANESRLANKLFDVTKVAGSDNGRQLSSQFVSALDTLTPKVNTKLMVAKYQIREMLKMPVTYKLEDDTAIEGTLQEAFYYMYGEYVKEKQIWADKQNEKKAELEDKYPGKSDEARLQREEEFLNWYQTVAETYLLQIQVKREKILAFFSPNDMKILEGILSSGSGAELEEAREQVEHAKKFDPDCGYVYPVTLQPADWFESLNSNMGFIDLLQSSDASTNDYVTASKNLAARARELIDSKSSDYTAELKDSYLQLETINEEIEDVKNKQKMALAKESEND